MRRTLLLFPSTLNEAYITLYRPSETFIILHPAFTIRWKYNALAINHRRDVAVSLAESSTATVVYPEDYAGFVASLMTKKKQEASIDVVAPFVPDDDVIADLRMFGARIVPNLSFCLSPNDYAEIYGNKLPTVAKTLKACIAKTGLDYGPSTDVYNREHLPDGHEPTTAIVFPTTRVAALKQLHDFIKHRLDNFGRYEDAISPKDQIVYHSGISASLNIGLLTIADITEMLKKNRDREHNSLEAFYRQVFGWREYMLAIWWYGPQTETKSTAKVNQHGTWSDFMIGRLSSKYIRQPSANAPKNVNDLLAVPGIVGIETAKAISSGYAHHIIRLMVIGNYLYLTNADPINAVNIFISLTVDAYPWVMYGNVVYMAMHTFGRVYTRKPYYSSGAYLRRMSCDEYRHDKTLTKVIDEEYTKKDQHERTSR